MAEVGEQSRHLRSIGRTRSHEDQTYVNGLAPRRSGGANGTVRSMRGAGDRLPRSQGEPGLTPIGETEVTSGCPACRAGRLHVTRFALKNGDRAEMRRCGHCTWKAWVLGGRQVALAELLGAVSAAGLPNAPRRPRTS